MICLRRSAGTCAPERGLSCRDLRAARMSWQRARQVADRLPAEDPDRTAMRIAPRALLCVSTFRAGGSVADTGFDELRDLATAADDKVSLAVGMAGQVWALWVHARDRESSQLAAEFTSLIESIGDPTLTVALLSAALTAKFQTGEIAEVLGLAQRIIDLADGDPDKGNLILESPLALATVYRATARACIGNPGWKSDLEQAVAMGRAYAPVGIPRFWSTSTFLAYRTGDCCPMRPLCGRRPRHSKLRNRRATNTHWRALDSRAASSWCSRRAQNVGMASTYLPRRVKPPCRTGSPWPPCRRSTSNLLRTRRAPTTLMAPSNYSARSSTTNSPRVKWLIAERP